MIAPRRALRSRLLKTRLRPLRRTRIMRRMPADGGPAWLPLGLRWRRMLAARVPGSTRIFHVRSAAVTPAAAVRSRIAPAAPVLPLPWRYLVLRLPGKAGHVAATAAPGNGSSGRKGADGIFRAMLATRITERLYMRGQASAVRIQPGLVRKDGYPAQYPAWAARARGPAPGARHIAAPEPGRAIRRTAGSAPGRERIAERGRLLRAGAAVPAASSARQQHAWRFPPAFATHPAQFRRTGRFAGKEQRPHMPSPQRRTVPLPSAAHLARRTGPRQTSAAILAPQARMAGHPASAAFPAAGSPAAHSATRVQRPRIAWQAETSAFLVRRPRQNGTSAAHAGARGYAPPQPPLRLQQLALARPVPQSRAARSAGWKPRPNEDWHAEASTFPAPRRQLRAPPQQQRQLRLLPGAVARAAPGKRARLAAALPPRAASMWRAAPAAHLASRTSGVAPAVHCVPRASARWQRALRPLPRVAALSAQQLSAPQSMASAPAAALALRLAQPSLAGPAPKSRAARSPGGKLRPIEARRAEAFTFPARRRRPGVSAALADRGGLQSQQRPLRLQPGSAAIAGPGRRARRAAAPPLRAATMWRAALAAYPASRTSGAAPATRGVPRAAAPTAQQRLAPKGPAPQNMVAAPAAAMALRLDMAWRATSAFAASAAQAGGEPRRPETGAAAFRPEHPHPAGGAGAPPATQRSHQPVVTLLDPAVAERLVEDVLRRAEQRMRIGRERRGL